MGHYRIITSTTQKLISIKAEGIWSISDGDSFIADFNREISKLNPKEYTLSFDCTYLGLISAATLFKLEQCFVLYKEADFLNVTFDTGGHTLLKNQVIRLSKQFKLTHYEVF